MSAEQIDRILHAFNGPPDRYRRDEVEEAVALREEITPRLLAILDEFATEPEKHTLPHLYAVSLLAHFKEPKAHQPIIRAFNLPLRVEYAQAWLRPPPTCGPRRSCQRSRRPTTTVLPARSPLGGTTSRSPSAQPALVLA